MKEFYLFCFFLFAFVPGIPTNSYCQNIGIGNGTPNRAKLEVFGAVGNTSGIFGGEGNGISLQHSYPAIGFNQYYNGNAKYMANGFAATQYLDPTNGSMVFNMYSNGVKDANAFSSHYGMVISNNGNIGIQTFPLDASLSVLKAGNSNASASFAGSLYTSYFGYDTNEDIYLRGGKNSSKVFLNDVGPKIVIGNGSTLVSINNGIPSYPLEVRQVSGKGVIFVEPNNSFNNWELRPEFYAANYPAPDLNMIYNGQYKSYFSWDAAHFYTYSDRRLKTNIQDMPELLENYMRLQPVEYEMKNDNSHRKVLGFIAQDVQKLFPDLVTLTIKDNRQPYPGIDSLYGLDYNGFRLLTIKALQEQQQKIKSMQVENEELEKRIEAAEKLLANKNHD